MTQSLNLKAMAPQSIIVFLTLQAYNCDDLYSLDSDYFLSSLEDISVQIW